MVQNNQTKDRIFVFPFVALQRWLLVLAFSIIVSGPWGLISWGGPAGGIMSVIYYIGSILGLGFFLVIGGVVLFCSEATRQVITQKQQQSTEPSFMSLLFSFIILSMVGLILATVIGVGFAIFNTEYFEIISYIPHMLLLEFCFLLLLCPVVVLLTQVFDDFKITVVIGMVLFLGLLISTGVPPFGTVFYPEVAFFGPANLLAALMFLLIGGYGQWSMSAYVGVEFSLIQLIAPILAFATLSIIALILARSFYNENLTRWAISLGDWVPVAEGEQESQVARNLSTMLGQLKSRRKMASTLVILLTLMIPLLSMSYVTYRQNDLTMIIYQSPDGGETLAIGEWKFEDFQGSDPGNNMYYLIHCEGEILQGGGSGDAKRFNFEHREMTLAEFQLLNETDIEDLFGSGESGNYGATTTFSSGRSGPIRDRHYVWGLRFLEVNGQITGTIRINMRVMLIPNA